ncbi:malic enzyme-like NAD(P)-binding protein, partial [Enterococcus faecalis]
IGQANNALVFPGLGLGTIVTKSKLITDGMFEACARAIAGMVNVGVPGAPMLPKVEDLRTVSATVAVEVAKTAMKEGVATEEPEDIIQAVQ